MEAASTSSLATLSLRAVGPSCLVNVLLLELRYKAYDFFKMMGQKQWIFFFFFQIEANEEESGSLKKQLYFVVAQGVGAGEA